VSAFLPEQIDIIAPVRVEAPAMMGTVVLE